MRHGLDIQIAAHLWHDLDIHICKYLVYKCAKIPRSSNWKKELHMYHYNNRGLFCDPHIIANNKERNFRKPAVANHNSSQTLKLLRYHNIRTCTIASPSQLLNLIQSQNFSDYNCFYPLFMINITSETICSKPITATT